MSIISDLVTLAKAGYTPKDIKEILEMKETIPDNKEGSLTKVVEESKKDEDTKKEVIESAFEKLVNTENDKNKGV